MKRFTYNGKKVGVVAFGYDFSRESGFCADVPVSNTHAIKKLTGNRFFDEVEVSDQEIHETHAAMCNETTINEPKAVSIGIFKKKEDGTPYSRPEKVFNGTDEEDLKTQATSWMEEKDINPEERLIRVK